nr:MBL fold metallo-hydrolase [Allomuricauda sp.]
MKAIGFLVVLLPFLFLGCVSSAEEKKDSSNALPQKGVSLLVLGTVQDGGSPHIGCKKECCANLFQNPDPKRKVTCLGVIDHKNKKTYLFEASPDIASQLKELKNRAGATEETPNGIFVTHAHIGHYTGLMYLGREALGGKKVPVFAMPKMEKFLSENGPWNQLIHLENIVIKPLFNEKKLRLSEDLSIIPFTVPHRDEYSETVGFKIIGPKKSVLFIPDIDKWSKWDKNIKEELAKVDLAFLDATFFSGDEINTRNISEIPHPFVIESMQLFEDLSEEEKEKIQFIHLNHTNPLLDMDSNQYSEVVQKGFNVAFFGEAFDL